MPGKAKSLTTKTRDENTLKEKWMQRAVQLYNARKGTPGAPGIREACEEMEIQCWEEDQEVIELKKSVLHRRIHGIPSQAESNATRGSWLNEQEADALIAYAIKLGNEGWAFSRERLGEHANEILRAREGPSFEGVGVNWADRFIEKYRNRLKPCWSRPLDNLRAQAGNAAYKAEYFSLLGETIEGEEGEDPIEEENTYGVDESGIQQGLGLKERVFGDPDKSFQHQQRSGGRENITVIATICADGTANVPPAVIYKSETYHTSWKQDNPLNAS